MNKVYPLTEDQILKMKDELKKNRNAKRDTFMFAFMLSVPLRVSDIARLKVEDVYNKDNLKLTQTKTGNKVELIIPETLKEAIKEYKKENKLRIDGYLFRSQKGGRLSTTQIYKIIKKAANAAGIDFEVGCHSTRKTWALQALESWGYENITTISKMLGHSSVENTKYYLHLTEQENRRLVEQLPVYL